MTQSGPVSIDEVRALVNERQRYDDWLTALEARRAETPSRVFDRVHGDYRTRRSEVMARLREHVPGLSAMGDELDGKLAALETQLATLEDERAEALLRTAVGEFDDARWEDVRQQVEAHIEELGQSRALLLGEVDEVRTLLSSARSEPDAAPEAAVPEADELSSAADAGAPLSAAHSEGAIDADLGGDVSESAALDWVPEAPVAAPELIDIVMPVAPVSDATSIEHTFVETIEIAPVAATHEEMADLDNALALFANDTPAEDVLSRAPSTGSQLGSTPTPVVNSAASANVPMPGATMTPGLDGLDVFDDAELGDLRMSPPSRATATVTPHSSNAADAKPAARDGFDDLAFLRSVVDPTAQGGVPRASASGDQAKTLRCTECGTMNLPTEWYCERCGGELAAF